MRSVDNINNELTRCVNILKSDLVSSNSPMLNDFIRSVNTATGSIQASYAVSLATDPNLSNMDNLNTIVDVVSKAKGPEQDLDSYQFVYNNHLREDNLVIPVVTKVANLSHAEVSDNAFLYRNFTKLRFLNSYEIIHSLKDGHELILKRN